MTEIDPGINDVLIKCGKPGIAEIDGRARRAQRCQTTRSSCTRSLSRFGSRCTKWHPWRGYAAPGTPSPRAPPTDRNVQVIVEIEARAATVERLFMISERQEWTFGQALEYALDALELALAKTATG
jgi:hypothetical protein